MPGLWRSLGLYSVVQAQEQTWWPLVLTPGRGFVIGGMEGTKGQGGRGVPEKAVVILESKCWG